MIKRNNPGNIRPAVIKWRGENTRAGQPFCEFIDLQHGCRAMLKLLQTYMHRHGLRTISGIITRWAPPSDNNDTSAYCSAVARMTGYAVHATLADTADVLIALANAMARVEHGGISPDQATWRAAWDMLD